MSNARIFVGEISGTAGAYTATPLREPGAATSIPPSLDPRTHRLRDQPQGLRPAEFSGPSSATQPSDQAIKR
jgi:hypothetical protein